MGEEKSGWGVSNSQPVSADPDGVRQTWRGERREHPGPGAE